MMPDVSGYDFCKNIRRTVDYPIIFLTAKSIEEDIIYGLSLGADDYIVKPFRLAELRARVSAHIRREKRDKQHYIRLKNCAIDLDSKCIAVGDEVIALTKSEYDICEYLATNAGITFSREQIYEKVFGYDGESDNTTISTHIKNIRNKFKLYSLDAIETVWGVGYRWTR